MGRSKRHATKDIGSPGSDNENKLEEKSVPSSAISFEDGLPLPKLVVFDLDYTLWPLWVDTHVTPPLKLAGQDRVKDRHGSSYGFYADVPGLLSDLRAANVKVGAASRTHTPDIARDMLNLLRVGRSKTWSKALDAFDYVQIYPGSKLTHFQKLHKESGIAYDEMLFFDDEQRNTEVEQLGVVMWLVPSGVSSHEFDNGVKSWRKRNSRMKVVDG